MKKIWAAVIAEHTKLAESFAKPAADETSRCKWFARCKNEATTSLPHPSRGNVPTCQRCADKVRILQWLDSH